MKCPKCAQTDSRVIDSRTIQEDKVIRRRRACDACGFRFTTFERVEGISLVVVKKDGLREPYIRSKLEEGIWRACSKRPVSVASINDMMNTLEESWMRTGEIASKTIGEDVMNALHALDDIAYIRFASVYRRFQDVDEFQREVLELFEKKKRGER
ncbi:transcriptional regulator NrdR [Candidatus Gracilibacteria bacterium CG17_big_fil_post_rev_8_21_14_2_50_48_13]|nr:MAG: transcriptional regulator NrdR [Candidatus Gracilibacteria bacterium CG17_big_fil_post_rev_8_21_14_2_50_48_13]